MGAMCVKQENHVLLFRSACEPVPLGAEGREEGRAELRGRRETGRKTERESAKGKRAESEEFAADRNHRKRNPNETKTTQNHKVDVVICISTPKSQQILPRTPRTRDKRANFGARDGHVCEDNGRDL